MAALLFLAISTFSFAKLIKMLKLAAWNSFILYSLCGSLSSWAMMHIGTKKTAVMSADVIEACSSPSHSPKDMIPWVRGVMTLSRMVT